MIAFVVSVINNFWLNRHWTFDAKRRASDVPGRALLRRLAGRVRVHLLVLVALVEVAGMSKVVAQAIAIVTATPLSFLGQKLWSFKA